MLEIFSVMLDQTKPSLDHMLDRNNKLNRNNWKLAWYDFVNLGFCVFCTLLSCVMCYSLCLTATVLL